MPVCKFFSSKSGCVRGDQCYFQHVQPASQQEFGSAITLPYVSRSWRTAGHGSTAPSKPPASGFPDPVAGVSCRFFASGACKNGDRCRFRHETTSGEEIPHEVTTEEETVHEIIPQQARMMTIKKGPANTSRMYQPHSLRRLQNRMLEI
jgi:CCCH-type zinc finger